MQRIPGLQKQLTEWRLILALTTRDRFCRQLSPPRKQPPGFSTRRASHAFIAASVSAIIGRAVNVGLFPRRASPWRRDASAYDLLSGYYDG